MKYIGKYFSLCLLAVLSCLLTSCNDKPVEESSDNPHGEDTPKEAEYIITADTGWDIYVAGTYRYGPSIIINDDGSIDAWFAATGASYAADAGELLYKEGDKQPVNLSSTEVGLAFTVDDPFYGLEVCCPTWSTSGTESMTMKLYSWDTDYQKTTKSTPLFEKRVERMEDNAWNEVISKDGQKFGAGRYLLVLGQGTSKAGVWFYSSAATLGGRGLQAFMGGTPTDGAPQVILNYDSLDGISGSYWDQVSYQRSTDGGKTWTEEEMVLKPTRGSRDELSCCDPGVIKIGEYYYLGYTSTENTAGVENHLYMARSKTQRGPWEKWNGKGWGGDGVEPVVTYTGSKGQWGVGEPSMVVLDGTLYLYYSWNDNNTTTRVVTAPAGDPLWPSKISDQRTAINKHDLKAADHCDVKYCDEMKRFIAVHTADRMTSSSYVQVWTSKDGLTFTMQKRVSGSLGKGLHNIGISGDAQGHIDLARQQYISYAYGLDSSGNSTWGQWSTKWNPIKFTKK